MNIKEIVEKYLIDNNYDGLHMDNNCSCAKDILMNCGECPTDCEPFRKDKENEKN